MRSEAWDQRGQSSGPGVPATLLELLALTYVVEERSGKRYEEHATRPDVDADTLKALHEMRVDEDWHLTWVGEALSELGKKEGTEKLSAALARYRAAEAEAFTEMLANEQKALQEIAAGNSE